MKRIKNFLLLLALASTTVPAWSIESKTNNVFYLGLGLGGVGTNMPVNDFAVEGDTESKKMGFMGELMAGYDFHCSNSPFLVGVFASLGLANSKNCTSGTDTFSVEPQNVSGAVSAENPVSAENIMVGSFDSEITGKGFMSAGIRLGYDLSNKFMVYALVGYVGQQLQTKVIQAAGEEEVVDSNVSLFNGLRVGLGGEYKVSDNWAVGVLLGFNTFHERTLILDDVEDSEGDKASAELAANNTFQVRPIQYSAMVSLKYLIPARR